MTTHRIVSPRAGLVGYLEERRAERRLRLTDAFRSRTIGEYDSNRDATLDDAGRVVGAGNQLLTLVAGDGESLWVTPIEEG